jgi:hypothetical protein
VSNTSHAKNQELETFARKRGEGFARGSVLRHDPSPRGCAFYSLPGPASWRRRSALATSNCGCERRGKKADPEGRRLNRSLAHRPPQLEVYGSYSAVRHHVSRFGEIPAKTDPFSLFKAQKSVWQSVPRGHNSAGPERRGRQGGTFGTTFSADKGSARPQNLLSERSQRVELMRVRSGRSRLDPARSLGGPRTLGLGGMPWPRRGPGLRWANSKTGSGSEASEVTRVALQASCPGLRDVNRNACGRAAAG